ncbi:hypothetical protein CROQUDRAFT_97943 [Cronartium quercuum f. sp. fusiforme G11]|uniref:Uncharacterized protein n=1 Tax=Cronartium quercuum f. sp. fusiforme G11 TaxID=708437 RepID=A0A9P6NA09_9BASI|nr:hypothetical protein CROQUDRAFT_97943 [Cronartium quercuum f. sp. fusiforme G11]
MHQLIFCCLKFCKGEPTWLFQAGSEAGLGFSLKVNNRKVCTGTTKYRLQLADLLKEGLLDF